MTYRYIYIAILSGLLAHGSVLEELILCTVIYVTDSANYRGIALSSIYGKIFDLVILSRYADKFCTSKLPFGFKRKHSTNMYMMMLKESLFYYANNGGSVYCTFLDATTAFDRVDYFKLFKLLVDRMIPPVSVRHPLNIYTSHVCRVSWIGVCSVPFSVLNGIKQGGVISPVPFVFLWINFLVNWLKQELAAISRIFSLVLLHNQMILCYWHLQLGLCDLCYL